MKLVLLITFCAFFAGSCKTTNANTEVEIAEGIVYEEHEKGRDSERSEDEIEEYDAYAWRQLRDREALGDGSGGIPARSFLCKDEVEHSDLGAYGYLLFTKRPGREEHDRYWNICDSYIRSLELLSSFSIENSTEFMVTYWPLEIETAYLGAIQSHVDLIEFYDYPKAIEIAGFIHKLEAYGPLLVAFTKSFARVTKNDSVLILDMSDFTDDDVDRAFSIWKDYITRDSEAWDGIGFKIIVARELFRNLLQKYGSDILAVIDV